MVEPLGARYALRHHLADACIAHLPFRQREHVDHRRTIGHVGVGKHGEATEHACVWNFAVRPIERYDDWISFMAAFRVPDDDDKRIVLSTRAFKATGTLSVTVLPALESPPQSHWEAEE